MSFVEKYSRKVLAILLALLIVVTLFYTNYITTSSSSSSSIDKVVSSGYLEEQTYFNGSQSDSTQSRPESSNCVCHDDHGVVDDNRNGSPPQEHAEGSPFIVPESFPPPPQTLLDKINSNLWEDRVLTVAVSNYGMRNHVYNWIESLKRTGEDKFLIFCLDDQLYHHLAEAGYENHASVIPEAWLHQEIEAGFEEYYTKKYRAITHAKTLVVQQLLYLDVKVLFSDVDIVWTRPRMREYIHTFLEIRHETHVMFQQEGFDQKVVNSGFYIMRPSDEMKRLLAETIYLQDTNEGMTQQGAMNAALDHLNMDIRTSTVVLLDVLHFPNGFVYFTHDLPKKHGVEPYIVHANYLVGEDKKRKLQESGLWYIDDQWLANLDAQAEQTMKKKGVATPTH
ncbi:nucleotide-diphospho-sugar transferase-domain-containing protein [Radiomyces spectabilis]|uniref:nucleotide-diphospho-sugar transferase-domain-containing protein n=1 Tax=Radiomyces spectabilis TaxID=64574 RepID=UPI00221EB03E|nr:nucleotide-diphospho-sugar transferase-domain-containing protein [Radiomyces spectabilis]KAI8384408.1 nucleotide-diphospho-sugar transferase-domain-containing protein [Radiomyces spectabilis]